MPCRSAQWQNYISFPGLFKNQGHPGIWVCPEGARQQVADKAGEVWIEAEERLAEEVDKLPKAKGTRGHLKGQNASGGPKMAPPEDVPAA
jgi:hypothetical protein